MVAALIPLKWAIFFTQVVGLVVLFVVIRKVVFYLSEHFLTPNESGLGNAPQRIHHEKDDK